MLGYVDGFLVGVELRDAIGLLVRLEAFGLLLVDWLAVGVEVGDVLGRLLRLDAFALSCLSLAYVPVDRARICKITI